MDILTEGLQKRKTELRPRMDYKNVKNSSWKKNIFYSAAK